MVSYWATLTFSNNEKFEFQRRVNKIVCKSPVGSRLYKQAKKPSDLRRIVRARKFGSKITSQKEILDFPSVLLIETQCIGNKYQLYKQASII